MYVNNDNSKPIKIWASDLEDGCLEQAFNLSNLPMLHGHVALMPDAHPGMGMPIGGVIALKNSVIPNAVGSDIGCGMIAIKSNLTYTPPKETREMFIKALSRRIPVGFAGHKEPVNDFEMPDPHKVYRVFYKEHLAADDSIVDQEYESARYKLGTLGGGKVNCFQAKRQESKTNSEILSNRLGTPTRRTTGAKVINHAERLNEKTLYKRSDSPNFGITRLKSQRGKQK